MLDLIRCTRKLHAQFRNDSLNCNVLPCYWLKNWVAESILLTFSANCVGQPAAGIVRSKGLFTKNTTSLETKRLIVKTQLIGKANN